MFIRKKRAGRYDYLQVVENHREGSHTRQRVVATLGRLDRLQADGDIDTLMRSLERFCAQVKLQEAHSRGELRALGAWSIGPELIFGRLWDRLKLPAIIGILEGASSSSTWRGPSPSRCCAVCSRQALTVRWRAG